MTTPAAGGTCLAGTTIPDRFRAVVFDMDGVLLDTAPLWSRAEHRLWAAHGMRPTGNDAFATRGVPAIEACRHYARRFGLPDAAAAILETQLLGFMTRELDGPIDAMPGAAELVARLRLLVPLAVASNSRSVVVERAIARAGLAEAFDALVSADDVVRPKPAPDLYRLSCTRLGVPPADALAIEDAPVGAEAALSAGLTCYLLSPHASVPGLGVERHVSALTELLAP